MHVPDLKWSDDLIYVLKNIRDVLTEIREEIHEISERLEKTESQR